MWNYVNTTIEGNVTREPTLKKTKTGKNVCEFSLAFHYPSGNDPDKGVSFIDVETWERLAEICSDNINKGKRVLVVGALRQDRWEDDEGKKHSKHKLVGQEVRLVDAMVKQASEPVQKAV